MAIDPHAPLRIGIVGAGRSRQGTGPYLAAAAEATGAVVAAVAGRDRAGGERAAAALSAACGHAVEVADDALALAERVDAVIVASPAPVHAVGVAAALAWSRPCLCEKPFVPFACGREALALASAFAAHEVFLTENCQWPEVLPGFFALHPERRGQPIRDLAMGLSPAGFGLAMIEDSLSHVLSLAQALAPIDAGAGVRAVRRRDGAAAAEHDVLSFELQSADGPVRVLLHLDRCPAPPRPAWFAVDGARVDRRIGEAYAISLVAGGREVGVPDPLHVLVARFVAQAREPDAEVRRLSVAAVRARARLGADILAAL